MGAIDTEALTMVRERLVRRRAEIGRTAFARVGQIGNADEIADPEYAEGLKLAVSAAIDYGLKAFEHDDGRASQIPIPVALPTQARLAARNGVSLDTVLRRYFAGYNLLADVVADEIESGHLLSAADLKQLMRNQATLFDRLIAVIGEEHTREYRSCSSSTEQRRTEQIDGLLEGEEIEAVDIPYDFGRRHVGAVAAGRHAAEVFGELASALDQRLLLLQRNDGTVWAWLGSRRGVSLDLLEAEVERLSSGVRIAVGEPGDGIAGWRLSNRQARAALPIATRSSRAFVRYARVARLASMLQDEVLFDSMRELYLAPLDRARDGGRTARETLRSYFATGGNVSSAAAMLGVNRNTVRRRLRALEEILPGQIGECAGDLEVALRLEELREHPTAAACDT